MLHALPLGAMLLREHQSDQALVNKGGCLTPICSMRGSVWMREMVMFFPYAGNDEAAPWMQFMCWSCQEYAVHVGAALLRSMMEPQYLMQAIVQWLNNQVWQYVHEGWSTKTGDVSGIIDQDRNWPDRQTEVWSHLNTSWKKPKLLG